MRPLHFTTALAGLLLVAAPAQDTDPVAPLESAFANKIDALQKPLTERYITALEALKKKYQSNNDPPSVAAIERELAEANARLASASPLFPSRLAPPKTTGLFNVAEEASTSSSRDSESDEIPRSAPGDINLSPTTATLTGGTNILEPQQIAQGFVERGAAITWTISDIAPGTYDIILDYSSGRKGGGGNLHVTALNAEADIAITPLGSWKTFRRKHAGGIRVTAPPVTVKLAVNTSTSPAGVLALRQLTLRPRPD